MTVIRPRRTPPERLGPTLRSARERAGLGVREAARRAGLSSGYLANLEHGDRSPSRSVAERLIVALALDGEEQAVVRGGAVGDAGEDHPWRRSFSPRKTLP